MLLHWSYFLSDVEQGSVTVESGEQISTLTLEDILAFATGATSFLFQDSSSKVPSPFCMMEGCFLQLPLVLCKCVYLYTGTMKCLKPIWHLAFSMPMAFLETCSYIVHFSLQFSSIQFHLGCTSNFAYIMLFSIIIIKTLFVISVRHSQCIITKFIYIHGAKIIQQLTVLDLNAFG